MPEETYETALQCFLSNRSVRLQTTIGQFENRKKSERARLRDDDPPANWPATWSGEPSRNLGLGPRAFRRNVETITPNFSPFVRPAGLGGKAQLLVLEHTLQRTIIKTGQPTNQAQ